MEAIEEALDAVEDPARTAARAGLHYVRDDAPGFGRRRCGRGFLLLGTDGSRLDDEAARARIGALAIPPAWTDVWICPAPRGHLQATGRDEKGRKQYLYHPDWEAARNEVKFNRMRLFGEALPQIRARYEDDLRRRKLSREKVLGTVVALLDRTLIRVGNAEYAQRNGSFGLTTLRDRHVAFDGQQVTFSFKGKSGKKHTIALDDPRLARIVRRCRDVPGYSLFQYYDDEGQRSTVSSADVNAYLYEAAAAPFTAKDFRTWGGTVLAATTLCTAPPCDDARQADRTVAAMVKTVAAQLGNTAAVCRKYYIHPAVVTAYHDGTLFDAWPALLEAAQPQDGLRPEEHALLCFLRRCS